MSDIASEVSAILAAGGFRPMPAGSMKGIYAQECAGGWWMGGVYADQAYSKHTAISEDTTFDPIEAAHELVAHVRGRVAPLAPDDQQIEVEIVSPAEAEAIAEVEALFDEPGEVGESPTDEAVDDDHLRGMGTEVPGPVHGEAEGESSFTPEKDVFDADFTTLEIPEEPLAEEFGVELLDDYPEATLPLLEGAETSEPPPETSGPIAYAASDLDALVREKLGRLSQIARELKALLQDGWTTEEFASKQSYVVGNTDTFGAFIGDQAIYDRFVEMSNLQGAQRRVEMHRELLEAELELIGQHRDYAGAVAFDPERLRDEQWMFGG